MKKEKFKWLKVLGIVVAIIVVIVIIISVIVNNVSNNISSISENDMNYYFTDYTVKEQKLTAYVNGTGSITSFNIQTLEVPTYSSVKETFVNDGDIVSAKQKLLRITNGGYSQNINSPIDGMYFEIENNGTKEYQIYDLKNIGIEMFVSEKDVALLQVNQKALVRITVLNKEIEGIVSYISKLPTEGKFKVKINVEYTDEIRFGYGASIRIVVTEKENVLVIPYNALQMDSDNKYYVIKSEFKSDFYNNYLYNTEIPEKSKTYVEIGTITNDQVEILSGLKSGDIIEEWDW